MWCSPIQASLKPSSSAQRSVCRSHWWPSKRPRSGGCEGIVNRPYCMRASGSCANGGQLDAQPCPRPDRSPLPSLAGERRGRRQIPPASQRITAGTRPASAETIGVGLAGTIFGVVRSLQKTRTDGDGRANAWRAAQACCSATFRWSFHMPNTPEPYCSLPTHGREISNPSPLQPPVATMPTEAARLRESPTALASAARVSAGWASGPQPVPWRSP